MTRKPCLRRLAVASVVGVAIASGPVSLRADALAEMVVRTTDLLTRGTVELEDRVTVSVKAERLRQEVKGVRTVVTRRGARYAKPGHRVTLDQLDRGLRYEVNLDAGTYAEESFASVRRQHEETVAAAEKVFRVDLAEPPPSLSVTVERMGERQDVHGRECERIVLRSRREVVLTASRGGGPAGGAPARFAMTFDVCLAPETPLMGELRRGEERVGALTGTRDDLAERQLRVFAARRDVLAVFELMQRLMEHELKKLGGTPIRWERVFTGPRRDESEVTLYHHSGEVIRIEDGVLDAASFEVPPGLTLDHRGSSRD